LHNSGQENFILAHFSFRKSAKEFAAKEKLEIVKERGEAAQIFGGLLVAAFSGEMRSDYFQNRAQNKIPDIISEILFIN